MKKTRKVRNNIYLRAAEYISSKPDFSLGFCSYLRNIEHIFGTDLKRSFPEFYLMRHSTYDPDGCLNDRFIKFNNQEERIMALLLARKVDL